jgi:hypothetical protein
MRSLTGLCSRIGTWLLAQRKMLGLRAVPSVSLARICPELAARGLRHRRHRLAWPALLPFARQAFKILTANRPRVSKWLRLLSEGELEAELRNIHALRCYGTNPQTTH